MDLGERAFSPIAPSYSFSHVLEMATPPSREEKVQHCMTIMRELRWIRGKTAPVLAKEWGLTVANLESISAEAWRRVKAEVTDPDATSATVCTALEKVMRDSLADDDRRNAIEASKVWAQIAGAVAPTKVQIGELEKLSDEEVEKRRLALLERLKGEGE